MKKTLGILGVLVAVAVFASLRNPDAFLSAYNMQNILQRAGLYGMLGIGVAFVIMGGGIDLSIGSQVGLVGCVVPLLLVDYAWPPATAILAAFLLAVAIGLWHGLLITKLQLQPFVVTLCGLLLYRGAARYVSHDRTLGLAVDMQYLRFPAVGSLALPGIADFRLPMPFVILVGLAIVAAVFLNRTIYGRYLLAIGRNEQAVRFSGINTERIVILSYVLSAVIAGWMGGLLFLFYQPSVQPDAHGSFYELYGIAAAVLGGCSLRGGEGSIVGVLLGAALIPVLYNASNVLGFPTTLEFATIGFVILAGAVVDEVVRRLAAAKRRRAAE